MRASAILYPLAATYVIVPTLAAPAPLRSTRDWHHDGTDGSLEKPFSNYKPEHRLAKRLTFSKSTLKVVGALTAAFISGVAWSGGDDFFRRILHMKDSSVPKTTALKNLTRRRLPDYMAPPKYQDRSPEGDHYPDDADDNASESNTLTMEELLNPSPDQQERYWQILGSLGPSQIHEIAQIMAENTLRVIQEHPELADGIDEATANLTAEQLQQFDSILRNAPDGDEEESLTAFWEETIGLLKTRAREALGGSESSVETHSRLYRRTPMRLPQLAPLERINWRGPQFWKATNYELWKNAGIGAAFLAAIGLVSTRISKYVNHKAAGASATNSTETSGSSMVDTAGDSSINITALQAPVPAVQKRSLSDPAAVDVQGSVSRRDLSRRAFSADVWKAIVGGIGMALGGVAFIKTIQDHPKLSSWFGNQTKRSLPVEKGEDVREHDHDHHLRKRGWKGIALIASSFVSAWLGSIAYDRAFKNHHPVKNATVPAVAQRRSIWIDELVYGDSSERELD
ncbi:hypothetical protein FRB97_004660 [Tulasnella sp. 331]|nr:hypothetical protein FRB97_004660 [Tulasnella sp. 331]